MSVWRYPDVYGGWMGQTFVPESDAFEGSAQAMIDEAATAVFGTAVPDWFHGPSARAGPRRS